MKLGSINACALAFLYDSAGRCIGHTADTPNAVAHAMAVNEAVAQSKSSLNNHHTRTTLQDRFWFAKQDNNLARELVWYKPTTK